MQPALKNMTRYNRLREDNVDRMTESELLMIWLNIYTFNKKKMHKLQTIPS